MYCPNPECPDYKETGMPGEYVAGVAVCPFCESRLVEEMPDMKARADKQEAQPGEKDAEPAEEAFATVDELDEDLVAVATFSLHQDAELAITYLIDQGIDVFEAPDEAGAPGVRLLAPKSQAKRAMYLIDQVPKET